ncbi:MAG: S-layer homology domain-containing protein [Candidatus Pristimantibacillus lignocellulolyticus]|uniref:S-layer homology domain-containing protein n=1 Tax=Candidatus Pristimantibacillus lignocellulolyticus TaxID=2994561 RepID=A0A9J6ZCV4_9BACL|nr:MAG: S-layer homology domain-containing protein [Candidatus Pristimantibacillus lignocellulolyticus]
MKKMTKKTIMLSAVALLAANALTFGPVSYKVSAADPAVVTTVSKLNNVYAQLDSQLKPLVDPAVDQVESYLDNADVALLLPNLWDALDAKPAFADQVKDELTIIAQLSIVELYPNITEISTELNDSLDRLNTLLDGEGFTKLNKADIDSFVNELERLALAAIKDQPLTAIDSFEEINALVTGQFDALVDLHWANSNYKVVTLLTELYPTKKALKDDFTNVRNVVETEIFAANPTVYKKASAALGLAYVKASLVTEGALGSAQRVDSNTYKFTQFKILGVNSLPFSAFNFEATGVTFEIGADGFLTAKTTSAITSATDIVITAKLKQGALVPSYLNNAKVFTQTVTLYPQGSVTPPVDTGLGLSTNADALAKSISDKLAAALAEIGELTSNKDIFALRAIVEEELRAALTVNAGSRVTSNNGVSELKLTPADLTNVFSQLDSVLKSTNAALQAVVKDADPVKPVLNLSVGNLDGVKVVISGELLSALKAKGIYAVGVTSNGALIEVPLTELAANNALQITKATGITLESTGGMKQVSALQANGALTGITPQLTGGMKQVSDVFNVVVIGADGKEKHEFLSQARIVLPVNSGSVNNEQFLTLAKIEGSKLINLGGTYIPGKKQFSAMRNSFSSYVVIENPVAFKDSSELAWAEDDILKAAAKGIIVGRAEGVFAPRAEITRAEFTAMLVRTLGIEVQTNTETFTDVNEDDWYQSVVATAAAYGFINGRTSTTFDPDAPITRSEMATITSNVLVKVLGYKPVGDVNETLNVFADQTEVVPAHRAGVALVAQEGIVQGKGLGIYDPKGTFTRAEAAVVINKLLSLR